MPGGDPALELMRDFSLISQIIVYPYVLLVYPSLPVRSLKALVAPAGARPGAITSGSSRMGSVLPRPQKCWPYKERSNLITLPMRGPAPH